jgi:hypothetical protein
MFDTNYNGHLQTKHSLEVNYTSTGAPQPTKAPEGKDAVQFYKEG